MKYLVYAFSSSLIFLVTTLLGGCDRVVGMAVEQSNKVQDIANSDRNTALKSCMKEAELADPGFLFSEQIIGYKKYHFNFRITVIHRKYNEPPSANDRAPKSTTIYDCETDNGVVTSLRRSMESNLNR